MITPRNNPDLLGHEIIEENLIASIKAGNLPHAIILSGEAGIGKATLAYRLAKYLLSSTQSHTNDTLYVPADLPPVRRILAEAHPDLIVIERHKDPTTGKVQKEISVDEIRKIAPFLRMTPAEGGWRIAIVDDSYALNRSGQNALLKILEEPPERSLIILIAERPGLLLPTIRSRCRMIPLASLSESILSKLIAQHAPDLQKEDVAALTTLSSGSLGRALSLVEEGGLSLYGEIVTLLQPMPRLEWQNIHGFGERMANPSAEPAYRLFVEFLPALIAKVVKSNVVERYVDVVEGEKQLAMRLAGMTPLDRWMAACEKIVQRFAVTDSANLDRKLAVWAAFAAMTEAVQVPDKI